MDLHGYGKLSVCPRPLSFMTTQPAVVLNTICTNYQLSHYLLNQHAGYVKASESFRLIVWKLAVSVIKLLAAYRLSTAACEYISVSVHLDPFRYRLNTKHLVNTACAAGVGN